MGDDEKKAGYHDIFGTSSDESDGEPQKRTKPKPSSPKKAADKPSAADLFGSSDEDEDEAPKPKKRRRLTKAGSKKGGDSDSDGEGGAAAAEDDAQEEIGAYGKEKARQTNAPPFRRR